MARPRLRLLVLASLILAAPAAAQEIQLRPQPMSHGASVTLGDLFTGLDGPAAAAVVAHAAPLGLDAVLDADEVQLAARRAGYDWRNASGFHRIVVTATASPPAEAARDPARAKAAVRGRRAAAALVYARNITSGDVLRAEDLIWSDDAVAPSDAVMDPDAAIGKVARHALRAGAPTADRDLASPVLIRRDDVVSVIFETDGVSLTLQGKALSDASVGRGVEVMNTQSKKIIQAVCDGPDEAVVGPRAEALRASSPSDPFAAFAKASLH